jgi:hypothetical protein
MSPSLCAKSAASLQPSSGVSIGTVARKASKLSTFNRRERRPRHAHFLCYRRYSFSQKIYTYNNKNSAPQQKLQPLAATDATIAIGMRIFFFLRFYCGPLYLYPTLHSVACILVCLAVGGLYLGVNFIISHNYEGVKVPLLSLPFFLCFFCFVDADLSY